jgi:diguanylate cyclase (GGDEF)-like protein
VIDDAHKIEWANAAFSSQFKAPAPQGELLNDVLATRTHALTEELLNHLNDPADNTLQYKDSATGAGLSLHIGQCLHARRLVVVNVQEAPKETVGPLECDPLTGLGNRAMFERLIKAPLLSQAAEDAAIMIIDLDDFKRINDTLGHPIGDKLLKLVAKRFRKVFRKDDTLIRLGGDEFIVLFSNNPSMASLEALGERIVQSASKFFIVDGNQIKIGASVGLAAANEDCSTWQDVYRHADLALYEAKHAGKSMVCAFSTEIEEAALRRRSLEMGLRSALVRKELAILYQPQIDIRSNTITGFEALLRWEHESLGQIRPDVFISIAEDIGEIHRIGSWVLKAACTEAANWPEAFKISVNVSPRQLIRPGFVDEVAQTLEETGLSADRLELEISEHIPLTNWF